MKRVLILQVLQSNDISKLNNILADPLKSIIRIKIFLTAQINLYNNKNHEKMVQVKY